MRGDPQTNEFDWGVFDEQPEDSWLVPPSHVIQDEERLTPDETKVLRDLIARRKPELLEQLALLGVRVQRPSERERVRQEIRDEFVEHGLTREGESSAYGELLLDLHERLAHI